MNSDQALQQVDLLVIGAGPVGMAAVTKLFETDDATINDVEHARSVQHRKAASNDVTSKPRIVVVDPNAEWMGQWKRLFSGLSITHLRSTITAHPCPFDTESLRRFAGEQGRLDEIHEAVLEDSLVSSVMTVDMSIFDETPSPSDDGKHAGRSKMVKAKTKKQRAKQVGFGAVQFSEADRNDFVLPGSKLFIDFCDSLVQKYRLNDLLVQGWVSDIQPLFAECPVSVPCEESSVECKHNAEPGRERLPERFLVTLSDGRQYVTKAVVSAVGNTNLPNVPAWIHSSEVEYPQHALGHAWDLAKEFAADHVVAMDQIEPSAVKLSSHEKCSSQPGCPKHSDFADCGISEMPSSSSSPAVSVAPSVRAGPEHLLVVGGGLTSAQLCHKALEKARRESRELRVTLAMRKSYVAVKQFDVDLAWFGRCKNLYSCKFLQLQNMQRRLQIVQQSRRGGSISPEAMKLLESWIESGHLEIRTGVEFHDARWNQSKSCWDVLFQTKSGQSSTPDAVMKTMHCDRMWLATGSHLDIRREASFRSLVSNIQHTPPLLGSGIPALQPDLRWLPGWNLFLAGAYAQLQIGPNAGNLFGARLAAGRLRDELVQLFKPESAPKPKSDFISQHDMKLNGAASSSDQSGDDFDHEDDIVKKPTARSHGKQPASDYEFTVRNTGNWFAALQMSDDDSDDE